MSTRSLACALLCVATTATLALAPAAAARPGVVRQDASIPLAAAGFGSSLRFPGRTTEVTLSIPVPAGLSPAALRGTMQLPAGAGRGWIDVLSAGRVLGRVEVPPGAPTAPVTLPLAGAEVDRNSADVTLRSYLGPLDDGWCANDWSDDSLSIVDATVDYTGDEAQPNVIADFLPPVLKRLSIYVPPQPSDDEISAALEFGAAITARFANQNPAVDLRALPEGQSLPTDPAGQLERQVVITDSDTASTTLQRSPADVPVLTLTGRGDGLINQTRLITSNIASITVASAAAAGSLDAAPSLAADQTTLAGIGATNLTATSTGRVQVVIGIDQTRLGRPSGPVRVHLIGNYTPLPDIQNGQITVSVGEDILDHWPIDADGRIDRWVDIPPANLSRYTELAVTLQVSGAMACGSTQPVTLSLDPAGAITSDANLPPHPSGFQALPQALMPTTQVGLRDGTYDDARRAMSLVTGLQSLTITPFRPTLVDFDTAATSNSPAILIAADGGVPDSVPLPLTEQDGTVQLTDLVGDAAPQAVNVPGLQFGSLQAAWDSGRGRMAVVATSNGDPAAVDRILGWLDADRTRWSGLSGDALFQTGDREPTPITVAEPEATTSSTSGVVRGVVIAGIVLLLAGVGVALALYAGSGRRRTRR